MYRTYIDSSFTLTQGSTTNLTTSPRGRRGRGRGQGRGLGRYGSTLSLTSVGSQRSANFGSTVTLTSPSPRRQGRGRGQRRGQGRGGVVVSRVITNSSLNTGNNSGKERRRFVWFSDPLGSWIIFYFLG